MALVATLTCLVQNKEFLENQASILESDLTKRAEKVTVLSSSICKVVESAKRRFCSVHSATGNRLLRKYFAQLHKHKDEPIDISSEIFDLASDLMQANKT